MVPGTDDEMVHAGLVVFLERVIDRDGPVEVLLIPPARDVQCGHGRRSNRRNHRLAFPELVVVRMRDVVVPRWNLSFEVTLVDVAERTDVEVPPEEVETIE